ncbi:MULTISPECIES: hypothetical protein [unclassified Streptomyces]|uniref:hypothetical protein n=1 Tax=unclassified Streptomyces TaxID=2593676 RepID=UPI001655B184|nr:hypothetical protein [Streptomyces sp. CB02980]MCB8902846.1 hypothetical protein [Streptomyces sp. CB02980]
MYDAVAGAGAGAVAVEESSGEGASLSWSEGVEGVEGSSEGGSSEVDGGVVLGSVAVGGCVGAFASDGLSPLSVRAEVRTAPAREKTPTMTAPMMVIRTASLCLPNQPCRRGGCGGGGGNGPPGEPAFRCGWLLGGMGAVDTETPCFSLVLVEIVETRCRGDLVAVNGLCRAPRLLLLVRESAPP